MLDDRKKLFYDWCQESGYFDESQLNEIYNGLLQLSLRDVRIFVRPDLDDKQMKQIRLGLEVLPVEQVLMYADKEFTAGQMWEIRQGLETLSISDVQAYAKIGISQFSMSSMRLNMQNKLFMKLFDIDPLYLTQSQVVAALRAVKKLPLDQASAIVDFRDNAREIEMKCVNREMEYFNQMEKQHGANKSKESTSICDDRIFDLIDSLTKDRLLEISEYVNAKIIFDDFEACDKIKKNIRI